MFFSRVDCLFLLVGFCVLLQAYGFVSNFPLSTAFQARGFDFKEGML